MRNVSLINEYLTESGTVITPRNKYSNLKNVSLSPRLHSTMWSRLDFKTKINPVFNKLWLYHVAQWMFRRNAGGITFLLTWCWKHCSLTWQIYCIVGTSTIFFCAGHLFSAKNPNLQNNILSSRGYYSFTFSKAMFLLWQHLITVLNSNTQTENELVTKNRLCL